MNLHLSTVETNLRSFEDSLGLAVEEVVPPKCLVQYFSTDTKFVGIHISKVTYPVRERETERERGEGESRYVYILYISFADSSPEAPPIQSRGKDHISMFRREVEGGVILILQPSAPVIDHLILG